MKIIIFFLMISNVEAANWKKLNTSGSSVIAENTNCPSGYIGVPALSPYSFRYFCVMKYEAKNDGYDNVTSTVAGLPYVSVTREVARDKCKNLGVGYDLISNDQWQTIARNIAGVGSNWDSGVVANSFLNIGNNTGTPSDASTDSDPCYGTGQTCSATLWNMLRRTHTLSNGNVIWDFAGNVYEWVTNDNTASNGTDVLIATANAGDIRQTRYGASSSTICATPAGGCGMGYGYFNYAGGSILRGGDGIFGTALIFDGSMANPTFGFRCIYVP